MGYAVYGFNSAGNHIHIVPHIAEVEAIASLMQLVAGAEGQQYNRRKGTSGAFWEDTCHGTIVENGRRLWNCLQYVDLNMIRVGVVRIWVHPGSSGSSDKFLSGSVKVSQTCIGRSLQRVEASAFFRSLHSTRCAP